VLDGTLFEFRQGKDIQTGSGSHLDFCLMDTGVNSCGSSGVSVNHSPLWGAEIKNECSYIFTPCVCLRGMDRGSFSFSGTEKEH